MPRTVEFREFGGGGDEVGLLGGIGLFYMEEMMKSKRKDEFLKVNGSLIIV